MTRHCETYLNSATRAWLPGSDKPSDHCGAVFLVVAIVSRLLPSRWRPRLPGTRARRTILGEAREAADTFVPFAFMA